MSADTLSGYNEAAEQVPEEALLGNLVWYTLSDIDINYEQARKDLEARGLDPDLLRPIRPVDAFRLATKEIERSFPMQENVKLNIMVRNLGQDADTVYRQVVCERVNTQAGKKRKLVYDPSAQLIYHRGKRDRNGKVTNDRVEVIRYNNAALERDLSSEQQGFIETRLSELPERFIHLRTHLGSHKVRNFVREFLYSLGAVAVRESGGVYFIRQERDEKLQELGDWVRNLNCSFHTTPLLDLINQREMLARAFEEEAISEIERMSKSIDEILEEQGRTVRESTFDEFALRAAELTAKANEYAEMLDIRSEVAFKRIDHFKRKTLDLADRIDHGKKGQKE